jgi:hypothetical protein
LKLRLKLCYSLWWRKGRNELESGVKDALNYLTAF